VIGEKKSVDQADRISETWSPKIMLYFSILLRFFVT
jgi:hypothetical protein